MVIPGHCADMHKHGQGAAASHSACEKCPAARPTKHLPMSFSPASPPLRQYLYGYTYLNFCCFRSAKRAFNTAAIAAFWQVQLQPTKLLQQCIRQSQETLLQGIHLHTAQCSLVLLVSPHTQRQCSTLWHRSPALRGIAQPALPQIPQHLLTDAARSAVRATALHPGEFMFVKLTQ